MTPSLASSTVMSSPARAAVDERPLRVVLIGNFSLDRQESMLRLRTFFETSLRERGHHVESWSPAPALVRLLPRYRYDGFAKLCGYVDKFVFFPRHVRRQLARTRRAGRAPELVHIIDHANAVYAPLFRDRPLLATCHDLLQIRAAHGEFPEHRLSARGRRYQHWILKHLKSVPHIACISTQTARDLTRLTRRTASSVSVIFNGLNYPFAPVPAPDASRLLASLLAGRRLPLDTLAAGGRGFLLNIGGGQWYKNRPGLLDLYAALRARWPAAPRLVLVGKPLDAALQRSAAEFGAELVHLGRVDGPQLAALYSCAEALLFPSLYEGFGWPIAEAQACGCAVFTSNRAPMTEVGGDAAAYLDPQDPSAAADAILAAWPARARMRQRGLARAPLFDQSRMLDDYVALYRRLVVHPAA